MKTQILTTLALSLLILNYPGEAAYALTQDNIEPHTTPVTTFEVATDDKQTFIAPDTIVTPPLDRFTYSATTPAEIAEKQRMEAEALAKQKAEEELQNRFTGMFASVDLSNSSCTRAFCWPVKNFSYSYDNNGFQTPGRPSHQGFDMLAPALTPIYAVTAGTVTVSSESYYGFGVAIVINSNIEGTNANLTYGHMSYGTRVVSEGEYVQAGQLIGLVGSTGNSSANHLHLEVNLNGGNVDPHTFLINYAG